MSKLAQAIGVFIILMGLMVIFFSEPVISYFANGPSSLQYFAGIFRLGIGFVFIKAARGSRHPTFLKVMGWLAVFGGVALLVLPPNLWARMMDWVSQSHVLSYRYIGAVVAMILGAFVVTAAGPGTAEGPEQ